MTQNRNKHHALLRWILWNLLRFHSTLIQIKTPRRLPNSPNYKYCEPISQQYISTRNSVEAWVPFISKDFMLTFNQRDGNEASNAEFFHDSALYNFTWLLFDCLALGGRRIEFLTKYSVTHCFSIHAWPPTGHFSHGDRVAKITWHGSLNIAREADTKALRSKQARNGGCFFQVRPLSVFLFLTALSSP